MERSYTPRHSLVSAVYATHRVSLMRWLVRRLRSREDAEDVSQEVFVRLCSTKTISSSEHAQALAFRMAFNIAIDVLRRRHARSVREVIDFDFTQMESDVPSPEDELLSLQQLDALTKVIRALPKKRRQVFILRKLEFLGCDEISQQLGMSRYAVEKQVTRGLVQCRQRFGRVAKE